MALSRIETCSDELDRIQDGQELELALGALDRNSRLLRQVRAALSRIDTGAFGICRDCEEVISTKRLAAAPWSEFCIVCQEAADCTAVQPGVQPWSVAGEPLIRAA